jgi:hypothetical protein
MEPETVKLNGELKKERVRERKEGVIERGRRWI